MFSVEQIHALLQRAVVSVAIANALLQPRLNVVIWKVVYTRVTTLYVRVKMSARMFLDAVSLMQTVEVLILQIDKLIRTSV